jgi:glycerophosphoryl diester phosphodiesterase
MLAFTRGIEQGADALEMDTRTTADDIPVIIHDETLDRTTNGRGALAVARWEAVRDLDVGRGERIPSLADVLDAFPDTPIILEIKERRAAAAVRRVLSRHRAQHRVVLGSFEHAALAPFGSGWHRAASRRESALFWMATRMGFGGQRARFEALTVPERMGRIQVVDERFVSVARRARKPVHVWTVDDPVQGRRLRALGVCGLVTNHPARLRASLAEVP